ncbi:Calx-beta domain-containing protein [Verrucomicrobiaceae bacterium 227]
MKNLQIPALLLASISTLLAAPDTVDQTFADSAGQVFDPTQYGGIASSIVQADGKVIFGSNEMAATVDGLPLQIPLIRFNPDGSVDSTYGADNVGNGAGKGIVFFSTGFSEVHDMTLQADGKLIAAGVMEGYSDNGTSITHGGKSIVRFNVDGTPDPTFATQGTVQSGGLNYINDVEMQSDGKILAAGGFGGVRNADGTFFSRKGLVRFNSDGSVDSAFALNLADFGAPAFASGFVRAVEVTAGGEIYAAIDFYNNSTKYFYGLCRLRPDGSRDHSFAPAYPGDFIQSLNLDSAGRILVAGRDEFATVSHVERFFSTGAKDPSFTLDPSLGLISDEQLEESPGGQYYFTSSGGSSAIRINGDGSLDPSFNATSDHPDAPGGPSSGFLRAFTLSPDGSVYAGSFFSSVNAIPTNKIVKFEGDATPGASVIDFTTTSLSVIEADKILTLSAVRTGDLSGPATATVSVTGGTADAGDFSSATPYTLTWPAGVGGARAFSISLRDDAVEDGDKTVNFSIASASGASVGSRDALVVTIVDDEAPASITSPPASLTAVSGADALFTVGIASATPATYQWQLDGVDIAGATGAKLILPTVSALLNEASITVVITNSAGIITSPVATLSVTTPDGSRDFSFPADPGGLAAVSQLVPLPDGSTILVPAAGGFRAPIKLSRILADGTLEADFGPTFINNSSTTQIYDVQVTPAGKMIVYGLFNSVDGVARSGLVRLTADGVIDTFFNPASGSLSRPFVDSAGRLYIAGGVSVGLVRLLENGEIDPAFTSSAGRDIRGGGSIYAMAEDGSGRLYVADFFSNNPNGFPSRLRRLLPDGSIDPTFGASPLPSLNTITALSDGRLAVGLSTDLIVLKENGQRDFSFQALAGTVGVVKKILEDRGGLLVGGGGLLTRYLASGLVDPSFPPAGGGVVTDAIRLSVDTLLLAAGGETFNGGAVPSVFSVFARKPTLDFVSREIVVAENSTSFDVTIRASGNVTGPITASVVSVDDTALAGVNFVAVSESLTFDASNLERTITVTLTDDAVSNPPREFTLQLASPDLGYVAEATIQIIDDESAPVITVQPQGVVVLSGQPVTLSVGVSDASDVTIQWYQNGQLINNATAFTYQPTLAGTYYAELSRNGNTITSEVAEVKFLLDGSAVKSGYGFFAPLSQNPVKVIKTGPQGAAYVGAQSQGVGSGTLSRILPDATADPAWAPVISGTIYDLIVEPDGASVVVGDLNIQGPAPVVTQIARYQSDGTRDLDFQTNVGTGCGVSGTIRVISRYPNGELLVGGNFSEWNGSPLSPSSSLVKLDASGVRIPGFNSDRNGVAVSAVALPDGGALVIYTNTVYQLAASGVTVASKFLNNGLKEISSAGPRKWLVVSSQNFSFNGTSGTVARLDSDLNIEQVFPITKAETAAGQANGKVIVGGTFISNSRRKIARFLADGSVDSSFSTANGLRTFSEIDGNLVTSLAERPDGSFWVGGTFPGYGPANQVSHANFVLINGDPVAIQILSEPAGRFINAGESVVLTASASSDLPLTYQWFRDGVSLSDGVGINGSQSAELTLSSPVTSGEFQLVIQGGPARSRTTPAFIGVFGIPEVLQISGDVNTASDLSVLLQVEAYGAGTLTYQWFKNGSPLPGRTTSLLNLPSAQTGDTGTYTVSITNDLASITPGPIEVTVLQNGASVVEGFVGPSVNGNINALLVLPDDKVLIGGDFNSFYNSDFSVRGGNYLAVMCKDGTVIPGTHPAPNNRVQALALQADGKIIVAGTFSDIGGSPRKQIARLNADLTLDPGFDPGDLFPGFTTIYNVAVDPDGKVLVVHTEGALKYLTRLLADGTHDPSFVVSPSSLVRKIIPQGDGTYLVAGYFANWDQTGPSTDSALVRIANDGSLLAPDFATSETRVTELFPLSNGDLFTTYQNLTLEILGSDGQAVSTRFNGFTANSSINDLVESPEGLIYLGGAFTEVNGQSASRLLRTSADGSRDPAFNVGTGFNDQVMTMALNDDGSIWVAGRFTQYNGLPANRITLLTGTLQPPAIRSFEDFMATTGLSAQESGFGNDPDQDGYSNGLEFLLGGNPEVSEPKLLPAPQLQAGNDLGLADGQDYLTLEISIADDLVDLPWLVQASTHLTFSGGDLEPAVQVGDPVMANGLATYLFRCPWPVQDPRSQGFLRLLLTATN